MTDLVEPVTPTTRVEPLAGAINSVGRGASIMLVATLCLLVFQFGSRVLVIHVLTVDQWGDFSLAVALTSLLALLTSLGIPTAVARTLAFETTAEDRWRVIRRATVVTLITAAAGSVIVFFFAPQIAAGFHKGALAPVLTLFSVTVATAVVSSVLAGFFQGLERVQPNAIFNQILNPALFLAFTALFLFFHLQFDAAIYGYVLAAAVSLSALAVYTVVKLPPLVASASTKTFEGDASGRVPFIELSITLFGVTALGYVTSFGDTLVLGLYRAADEVAQYSSAMTLARLFLVGAGTITYIYLPVAARLRRQGDFDTMRRSYVTTSRWLMVITLPLFFLFFFDPVSSLGFAFGRLYEPAAEALQILTLSSLLAVLLGPAPSALGGLGESRVMLIFTLSSAVANVALSFTLIPLYGLLGAALAWAIARVLYPALCMTRLWAGYRITPVSWNSARPLVLSALLLVPVFVLLLPEPRPILLPLLFFLVLFVFLGSIVLTRSVDSGDILVVGVLERRLGRPMPGLRRFLEARSPLAIPATKTP